jgi:branched chain amino acid efflux pump
MDRRRDFRDGFIAIIPLWLGSIPFALAYALVARTSGFSSLETIAMSYLIFAGAAMLSILDLAQHHTGYLAILATVLLLNLRHVLYALTLDLKLSPPRTIPKPVLAAGLTDEGMGLTIAHTQQKPATDWFFMGTVVSLYLSFTTATVVGVILGGRIPDPDRLHLDVVFPLTFLALLLPLIRNRRALVIAFTAAMLAVSLRPIIGASNATLVAIVGGAALGMFLPDRAATGDAIVSEDAPA